MSEAAAYTPLPETAGARHKHEHRHQHQHHHQHGDVKPNADVPSLLLTVLTFILLTIGTGMSEWSTAELSVTGFSAKLHGGLWTVCRFFYENGALDSKSCSTPEKQYSQTPFHGDNLLVVINVMRILLVVAVLAILACSLFVILSFLRALAPHSRRVQLFALIGAAVGSACSVIGALLAYPYNANLRDQMSGYIKRLGYQEGSMVDVRIGACAYLCGVAGLIAFALAIRISGIFRKLVLFPSTAAGGRSGHAVLVDDEEIDERATSTYVPPSAL